MIGHFVNNLTREQEDRVLTRKLAAAVRYRNCDGSMCLVGAAGYLDAFGHSFQPNLWAGTVWPAVPHGIDSIRFSVGERYDRLVHRFGERLNISIRNRILANRARRQLHQTYANKEASLCLSSQ